MQSLMLTDSRGDVVLTASSRELDPNREYWLNGEIKGWVGGYTMRGENQERAGHGSFPTTRTRSPRTLELPLRVHAESWAAANVEKRRLSALLADGESATLRVEESGVPALEAVVERTGEILPSRVSPSTFGLSVPLTAPDPVLYGDERVTFLHPMGTGIGLRYPLFSPAGVLNYGTGITSNDPVFNGGNVEAWPTYLVVGDFPGGARITVAGRTVEWPWPINRGAPLEVRMAGSVWIGGTNVTHRATVRQWSSIPPGGSVSPDFSPLQGGDGWCEVHHRDTYM